MTELLARLFIKNHNDVKNPAVRKNYGVMMSVIGITANILLSVGKFVMGAVSGAISITADAINNLSDAGSQIISLISFRISAKPADRDHPFGHARMEYVASMIVSFIVLLVGFELAKESVIKILRPQKAEYGVYTLIILALSIAVKLWLCLAGRRVDKKIDSTVIRATSSDSLSDALATSAVLASAIIARLTGVNTDGYMGAAVSVLILVSGVKILNETKNSILGTAPDREVTDGILEITSHYPDILGVHDLVVHSYGAGRTIASLHAEVDGTRDAYYIHDVIDRAEKELLSKLSVHATIHMDPTVTDNEQVSALRTLAGEAAAEVSENMALHDFRAFATPTGTVLEFDVAAPYELRMTDEDVAAAIAGMISERDSTLRCEITVDRV